MNNVYNFNELFKDHLRIYLTILLIIFYSNQFSDFLCKLKKLILIINLILYNYHNF
jgi:hypothetical protein